jgi:hypothetical protein
MGARNVDEETIRRWISENSGGSSYLVYTALLSQSGTDAPNVVELENTIGDIIWTRSSTGLYFGTLTGAFPDGKTLITGFGNKNGGYVTIGIANSLPFDHGYSINCNSEDVVGINVYKTSDYTNVELSDLLTAPRGIPIEIKVYQ